MSEVVPEESAQDKVTRETKAAKRIAEILDELQCDSIITQQVRAAGPLSISEAVVEIKAR